MLSQLHDLSRLLATGTARQRRHAWQSLLSQGNLWRGCEEAVRSDDGLPVLAEAYRYLSGGWDRTPIVELCLGDAEGVEERIAAACRILGAAAIASLSAEPLDPDRLLLWGLRALGETEPLSTDGTVRLQGRGAGGESGEEFVRHCFQMLAPLGPQQSARIAASQDAALSILAGSRRHGVPRRVLHQVRRPVLFARGDEGLP